MSTRSFIGMQLPNGTIRGIYCHFDGYLSHNGKILLSHYNSEAKVENLINLGHLSSLEADLGVQHDFNTHKSASGMCLAYGRDRGDSEQEAFVYKDAAAFVKAATQSWAEYAYLFRAGAWHWRTINREGARFRKLTLMNCKYDPKA